MTSGSAVKCLSHVVSQIGAFQNLISDRAAAFLGVVMTSFLELFDITKISTSSYSPRSNSKVERLQKTLIECLKATCVEGRPWATALIFVQMDLGSAPIVGLGLSAFELTTSGYRINLPMDVVKIDSFDEGHQHPNEIIKGIRADLDLMNKIVREHIIENQKEMKLTFDEKVTPYSYSVGGIVLLNDPVEKVGVSGKLRMVWCGPYQITWLSSHNCRLIHTLTGKVINGLVHINRIKPYFYRDELLEDLEDAMDGDEARLDKA